LKVDRSKFEVRSSGVRSSGVGHCLWPLSLRGLRRTGLQWRATACLGCPTVRVLR